MSEFMKWLRSAPVVWKPLGEVADIYGGLTGKTKYDFENGNALFVPYKNIFNHIEVNPNELASVTIQEYEKQNRIEYGDILFTGSSETANEVAYSCAVTTHFDEPLYLNSFSFGVRFHDGINLTPEFTKYLFRSDLLRKQIIKTANGVTRYNVSKERFKKILIPIPPMEVQEEIVRILDKFTELIAALNKELELRRKQYDYYLHHLLTFDPSEVTYKPLGELCSYIRGITYKKHDVADKGENSWKVLRANNITLENKQLNFDDVKKVSYHVKVRDDQKLYKGDILMCASSGSKEHVGKTTYIADDLDYTFGGFMSVIRTTSQDTLSKYIYYLLNSRLFSDYLDKSLNSSTINNIYASLINDFIIPIPPLSEQERIVGILDKFERLTHSLTEGLPREIELRQKQYEYYRNLLLSFE